MNQQSNIKIIHISSLTFFIVCAITTLGVLLLGNFYLFSIWFIAIGVFVTVISLFVFGSIRYRIDKNALTYGAVLIITAIFWHIWWPQSYLRQSFESQNYDQVWRFIKHYFLSLHGLDQLVHADTMLFILGLTLFVSIIAQTRLLETVSFKVLEKSKGAVVTTVAILTAIVSFASGILDGVSMIGLMIRTLVIILFLAKASDRAVLYSVMVSTIVTTVCGMWLAYGEPPNLIMKANLHPYLNDAFFIRYCMPAAVGSYFVVFLNIRRQLRGSRVELAKLDILDTHTADVRFLQATRHGKVLIPVEFIDDYKELLANHYESVQNRLHQGDPLGSAMIKEDVPEKIRRELLGQFVSKEIADALDQHYLHVVKENNEGVDQSAQKINEILESIRKERIHSQKIGAISFIPFIGFLIWHAINHNVPLFFASFAGFAIAFLGVLPFSNIRKLALKEAKHEYTEYLFLLPLFFSITLLQKTGFFNQISNLLHYGIERLGSSHIAFIQFVGATFLSAVLDNNVVADFVSRALHGLELGILHLFAMAQIAGYAVGGCWTHIGSAQSVVSYAFIRKEIDEHFTPFQWIKVMTPIILEIFALMVVVVYGTGLILHYFPER